MRSRRCPVCSYRMLVYENQPRLVCPRANRHYLYLNGKKLGKKGYTKSIPGFKKKKK